MSRDKTNSMIMTGRIWVLRDPDGAMIDDIDTDMIFHNAHLAVTDVAQMGQYALGNLASYEDFPARVNHGDMVLAGRNFGSGSSRQQAVDCFVSLGVTLLMAESFGAIYKRNAINAGFPIMEAAGLSEAPSRAGQARPGTHGAPWVQTGEKMQVDLASGEVTHQGTGDVYQARPMSGVQQDIYLAGDLFAYGKSVAAS